MVVSLLPSIISISFSILMVRLSAVVGKIDSCILLLHSEVDSLLHVDSLSEFLAIENHDDNHDGNNEVPVLETVQVLLLISSTF